MSDIETTTRDVNLDLDDESGHARKYLGFRLGDETFGLRILAVQEIIGMMEITRVPKSPAYIRGVINLRGRVLPVICLRAKFELETVEQTERTCIIVVQVRSADREVTMGIVVDEVSEVMEIPDAKIEAPPALGDDSATDFLLGMGKFEDDVVMLLEVEKIVSGRDLADISELSET